MQGMIHVKKPNEAWQFLEDLAKKNLQWEMTRKLERSTLLRDGIHQIQAFLAVEAKIATLTRRLENLELQRSPIMDQVSTPMCNGCSAPDHVLEECLRMNPTENGYAQVNATFQSLMNNPYASIYNPEWRNYPNFSWSQNPNVGGPRFN